ncbi:MAG: non-heme iron oxygenase ferredoxin subunit [Caldilineales bacterium]|nr:non-heme iron oxygenase ferredoxin subunit [Caldilineales bacterium]MDW8318555.1 non-heme iron oxygenase ferredoxin subunit [Anaerolineae bacterium]
MATLVKVASVGEIAPGGRKVVELNGDLIALFNVDNEQYYAIEDVCTHDGGPLADGDMVDTYEIECPRHGARFDIRTGAALCMPAFEPVQTYEVVVKDGAIFLVAEE